MAEVQAVKAHAEDVMSAAMRRQLPAPLSELSPWLDWQTTPLAEVLSALAAQRHRRFNHAEEAKIGHPQFGIPWIRASIRHHFGEAHYCRVSHTMVNKDPIAFPHCKNCPNGLRIANAIPNCAAFLL